MPPVPGWFRYLAYAMAALLGLSAALQYNDPDPLRWVAIYGAGMAVSIALPHQRGAWLIGFVLGLAALAWALYLLTVVWGRMEVSDLTSKMSEKGGAVEQGREAGGLGIEAVWLLFASGFRRTRA